MMTLIFLQYTVRIQLNALNNNSYTCTLRFCLQVDICSYHVLLVALSRAKGNYPDLKLFVATLADNAAVNAGIQKVCGLVGGSASNSGSSSSAVLDDLEKRVAALEAKLLAGSKVN